MLVLETGVGNRRMQAALDWLGQKPSGYAPDLVVSAGYSGSLRDDLEIGDIIVASAVVDENGSSWPATWPGEVVPFRRGRLLTVSRTIGDPNEEKALAARHDVVAVDMETATVAAMCSRHGIPFGCVRAISDDVHTPLSPELDAVIVNGRMSPWPLIAGVIRRPRLGVELWRLAKHTRLAADRLASALRQLLKLM
jgi:adenosylhomocysteine nucleosidase